MYFKFNTIAMLVEPLMLVAGFFLFFVACIAYARLDFPISKSSASYQARIQREEVMVMSMMGMSGRFLEAQSLLMTWVLQLMDAVQKLQGVFSFRRTHVSEKLEASLRDLARTGDVQSCKMARKAADAASKESSKDLSAKLQSLQSSPRPFNILPKVGFFFAFHAFTPVVPLECNFVL